MELVSWCTPHVIIHDSSMFRKAQPSLATVIFWRVDPFDIPHPQCQESFGIFIGLVTTMIPWKRRKGRGIRGMFRPLDRTDTPTYPPAVDGWNPKQPPGMWKTL